MSMKRMGDRVTFEHYRVLQREDGSLWKLGSGAMGVTYKALDTNLLCPVALKVINSNLTADEVHRNRFLREARAAAGLRHGNVASVYHLAKDEEQFYYAMEFIDGETTEAYVRRCGPMTLRAALRVTWQVSKALAAAARQQLVHRDIKPANIMIVADSEEEDWPFVKLIDFGLVRSMLPARDSATTMQSSFLGTAQFASPEQIEEGEVDVRSDIYSLGCTLWYLLTGEAPFTGSLAGVFAQHLGSEPPWEKLRPFPKPIRRLLRRMLPKEASQRPPSAMELRREIQQCLNDVERREALAARITLPFNVGRRWLNAVPRSRIVVICSVCAIGLMLAFGYNGKNSGSPGSAPPVQTSGLVPAESSAKSNEWFAKEDPGWSYLGTNPSSRSAPAMQTRGWSYLGTIPSPGSTPAMQTRVGTSPSPGSAPAMQTRVGTSPSPGSTPAMQTSGVVRAPDSADSNEWPAEEGRGWSYLGIWDERFWSLASAQVSLGGTAAPDGGVTDAKSWPPKDSIWDAEVVELFAIKNDFWRGRKDPLSTAITLDKRFSVRGGENERATISKVSIRDKDEVKKTTKRSVKKPQRRVANRERDRGFNPLQEVQRARENIRRVIRRIL
jgi:serine/threonine protein kinase